MDGSVGARRARRDDDGQAPAVEWTGSIWRIRSYAAARELLQLREMTAQAGFTAEFIPTGLLRHRPILISDGPLHDEQRRTVGRLLSPTVVRERYLPLMVSSSDALIAEAVDSGRCDVDTVALHYSVDVTRQVVGLTNSSLAGLARRLTAFFNQPPFDITQPGLGRTRGQWAQAAVNGLLPILRFHLADVRPAIRARRREASSDIVSHLIAQGYTELDILVECLTYGTGGMVTTREFIAMALWHLLTTPGLRDDYLGSDQERRLALLAEIIRLEPVVGHLYRRMTTGWTLSEAGESFHLSAGDLVDICVRDTNTDARAVGADAAALRPGRPRAAGAHPVGLSFGDGAHRCPGQALALLESDVFIHRLLEQRPAVASEPRIEWDDLVAGYCLRGFELTFAAR